jgi:hypothetical protein
MQRTVEAHIRDLQQIVHQLNDQLMHQADLRLRNELETRVRAAESALRHCRTALELEQSVARH